MNIFRSHIFVHTPLTFMAKSFVSRIPKFSEGWQSNQTQIHILNAEEAASIVPQHRLKQFQDKKQTSSTAIEGSGAQTKQITSNYYNESSWRKLKEISSSSSIRFSKQIQKRSNFLGISSEVLMKSYKFSRKEKDQKEVSINLQNFEQKEYLLQLVRAKIRAAELANSRGNEINTNEMLKKAQKIAADHPEVKITVIRGEQLLKQGFRLMHAVGRSSSNQSIFVALKWRGKPESDEFVSFVGKGLCFDSGGLNLKPTSGIAGMHNDKHGACSVLSAFEGVANLKLKANVVAVVGLAENFVNEDSYRPLDIIKSRKGLTVEIGNTDAQGRLVLADCMNWVQEKYKVKTMLELSTLTGAIRIALGKNRAGLFTNSSDLAKEISEAGEEVEQLVWRLPVDEYHEELVKAKQADITNSSGKPDGSSCQAAAFLKNFVEKGVQWAHIDIAGVADEGSSSTGYGAKLLLHYLYRGKA